MVLKWLMHFRHLRQLYGFHYKSAYESHITNIKIYFNWVQFNVSGWWSVRTIGSTHTYRANFLSYVRLEGPTHSRVKLSRKTHVRTRVGPSGLLRVTLSGSRKKTVKVKSPVISVHEFVVATKPGDLRVGGLLLPLLVGRWWSLSHLHLVTFFEA